MITMPTFTEKPNNYQRLLQKWGGVWHPHALLQHALDLKLFFIDKIHGFVTTSNTLLHKQYFLLGIILSAFYFGYVFTQIPGGLLAKRIGGKWVFGCGVLGTALLSIATPIAAKMDVKLLIAVRVWEGLVEVSISSHFYSFGCNFCKWIMKHA